MIRIGLVSCSSMKLPHAAPVRELYCSPLFKAATRYSITHCDWTYVLSAMHGIVTLDQRLEPYNVSLCGGRAGHKRLPKADRVEWGYRVVGQLETLHPERGALVMLAGREYIDPILRALLTQEYAEDSKAIETRAPQWPHRWSMEQPLAGMQIGQRLSFLTRFDRTTTTEAHQ